MSAQITARYRGLVEQLGAEANFARGWQTAVARRLGVHHSLINRLARGRAGRVSRETLDRACAALGIPAAYFDAPPDDARSYRAWQEAAPTAGPSGLVELVVFPTRAGAWGARARGDGRTVRVIGASSPEAAATEALARIRVARSR